MVEALKAVWDLGSEWLTKNVRNLFAVLRSPRGFMMSQELDENPPLLEASAFAVFISMLNLIIHLPLFRTISVQAETATYVLIDTVLTYAFWFLYGSLFHAAAWVLRGRRNYQATLSCFLYMTAFFPLLLLISSPSELIVRRQILNYRKPLDLNFYVQTTNLLSTPAILIVVAGGIYFFIAMIAAMRTVHQVGRFRGFLIVAAGFLAWATISALIETPALQMFWQAFEKKN